MCSLRWKYQLASPSGHFTLKTQRNISFGQSYSTRPKVETPTSWKVHKEKSPEEYERDWVGKYIPYFQANVIFPIPEIWKVQVPLILSLSVFDIKTKRLAGLEKGSFEEFMHTVGI